MIVHGQAIGRIGAGPRWRIHGAGGLRSGRPDPQRDAGRLSRSDRLRLQNIRAIATEKYRSKTNPLGAKGAGEGGMVAVAAAANAVAAALAPLGVEVRELPLSLVNIAKLIAAHRSAEDIASVLKTVLY